MKWLGTPIQKYASDLMAYQEILFDLKPDWLIEVGTWNGGSACFFASVMDLVGKGRVITIDLPYDKSRTASIGESYRPPPAVSHQRVTFIEGNSLSPGVLNQVREMVSGSVMVSLDGDHSEEQVLHELRAYGALVTPGHYLVAEDTDIDWPHGPHQAVKRFLKEDSRFIVDEHRRPEHMTHNPGGYLLRIA